MGNNKDDPDRLSVQEVHEALAQMSAADWARAERNAVLVARGLAGMTGEDVLGEVVAQLLADERRFPQGKRPVVVLKNASRSVANNARRSAWERRRADDVAVEPESNPDDFEGAEDARPVAPAAVDGRTPEDEALAKEQLDDFLNAIEDDPDAQLVAIAWAEGSRGAEAIAATELDPKAYDAARKRVMRKDPRGGKP